MLSALLAVALSQVAPDAGLDTPTQIDSVRVQGLWLTKEHVVRRELPWREGELVDPSAWQLGLTRLWNTGIFSRVSGEVVQEDGRRVAVLTVEDRFTLNPLFRFGSGGGAWWLRGGLQEVNLLGRFVEVAALYERFRTFNGGQVWVRDPRFLDRRLELYAQADLLFRPRPTFAQRRGTVSVLLSQEFEDRARLGFRVEGFTDTFFAPLDGASVEERPPDSFGVAVGPTLRVGRVDTVRLRQRGAALEVKPSVFVTSDPATPYFGQATAELTAFWLLGERVNAAARVFGGASTPAPPQHRFYLGGLDSVRGFPDNVLRARLYSAANVELRVVAFDSMWFAVMPAVFLDGAVALGDAGAPVALASAGGGVRLLVPRLVKTGVRIDLAVPLTRAPTVDLSLGVYQFF